MNHQIDKRISSQSNIMYPGTFQMRAWTNTILKSEDVQVWFKFPTCLTCFGKILALRYIVDKCKPSYGVHGPQHFLGLRYTRVPKARTDTFFVCDSARSQTERSTRPWSLPSHQPEANDATAAKRSKLRCESSEPCEMILKLVWARISLSQITVPDVNLQAVHGHAKNLSLHF